MANVQIKRYSGSAWVDINPKTTIGQVINLSSQLANMQSDIDGKAASVHYHDDRYYTETEIQSSTIYARDIRVNPNGTPMSNLGSPTIAEMALFQEQFNNKTEFYDITKIKFYTSNDNVNWAEIATFTDASKRIFVGGDSSTAGITIPNNTPYFRIEIENDGNYVYLNALYMYWQSSGHSSKVRIWKKPHNTQVWGIVTNSNSSVSSWPGHLYLPFPTIPFHPTGTTHADAIRIEFENTWNLNSSTNPSGWNLPIYLHKMQIWGGYPAGKRTIYSVNEYKDVNFPSQIKEMNQRVYSPNNKPTPAAIGARPDTWTPTADEISGMGNIGKVISQPTAFDFDSADVPSGIYSFNNLHVNNPPWGRYGTIIQTQYRVGTGGRYGVQIALSVDYNRMATRLTKSSGNTPWVELLYSDKISAWAKAANPPTPADIGAATATHSHPKSQITNFDSEVLALSPAGARPASDVSAWAKKASLDLSDVPTISIAKGGTGATTALAARANLGLGNGATASNVIRQSNWDTTNKILTIEVV